MTKKTLSKPLLKSEWLFFLKNFLKYPAQVAYLFPSSRYLEGRVAKAANLSQAKYVVELGPGTGGTTKAILSHMPPKARLLVVEINGSFCQFIEENIRDDRLLVHHGSAERLEEVLRELGWPQIDAVLSGIPFSSTPREIGLKIIESAHEVLQIKGRFVAYQLRDTVKALGVRVMGPASSKIEIRNFPPLRIHVWEKRHAA